MLKKSIEKTKLLSSVKPLAFAVCTILSTGIATQVYAAAGDKVGGEFLVNTTTSDRKQEPAIATNSEGTSVITWASRDQGTGPNGYHIFAQRYNVNGTKAGDEFLVTIVGSGDNNTPDVAMDANGNFVIVWRTHINSDDYDVYGQRYNASGTKVNGAFIVNTNMTDTQENPQIAMDTDGDFVVTWQSGDITDADIYGQRYQADGNVLGGEFRVNTTTDSGQLNPSVAMDATGAFVVTWDSYGQDNTNGINQTGVYAQRYTTNGDSLGGEFLVNTETNDAQSVPDIAMEANGNFIIAWQSNSQDGNGFGIYAQRYNAAGNTVDGEFRVNTETNSNQGLPSVAMDTDGGFVVAWQSRDQAVAINNEDVVLDIYAQRYSKDGDTIGSEFLVNTEIEDNQSNPVVAMDGNGEFVVAWQSGNQVPGDEFAIYAQRYEGETDNTVSNSGGGSGGSLSWLMGVLLVPFAFRRKRKS